MISTDPAGFDSEATGAFKVQPLGEAVPLTEPSGLGGEGFGPLGERLEAQAQAHVDEYGHPSDCQGCAAPTCGPVGPYGYTPSRILMDPSLTHPPVSLVYAHSDGKTFTRVDMDNPLTNSSGDDDVHRERLLLRALLTHTLAMLNGEDVS